MIKIQDALSELISKDSFLQFGISNRLFNLTRLSTFLKPLLEVRVKKSIKQQALLMSLSRTSSRFRKVVRGIEDYKAESITIISSLLIVTYPNNPRIHTLLNQLYKEVLDQKGYITITEGNHEITLIIEYKLKELVLKVIEEKPKYYNQEISGVGIRFAEKYSDIPGFLNAVLQQMTLQGINIIEISSTFTELILYIDSRDTKIAFDTVYERFL